MTDTDSFNPLDWYQVGQRDWIAAQTLLRSDDEVLAVAGMLLQQGLEKYLKGYLLAKGWTLRRTHDLGVLLKTLIEYEPDFSDFVGACLRITDFYVENRYPLYVASPVIRADMERLFAEAGALIHRIQSRSASAQQ